MFTPLLALIPMIGLAQADALEDGVLALQEGRAAEARDLLKQATQATPSNPEPWWELGWALWVLEDYAGVVKAWEKVATLDPGRAELDRWLSTARTRQSLGAIDTSNVSVPMEATGKTLTVAAAGDTMLGSDLRRGERGLAPGNGEGILADAASIFSAADVAFLNLEGTLADGLPQTKCGPNSSSCYAFRTPTRYTAALTAASIDVVSNANNHSMDLGPLGMDATLAALDAAGVEHASRYGDVAMFERGGLKIAVVAAHSGSCCLNVNRLAEVQGAIVQADAEADIVIFSFHGGAEGSSARHVPGRTEVAWGERRGDVKALGRAAVDAGADLVIGHGPHVLRAMEVYRGRLIAYSMGNFVGFRQFGTGGGHGGTSAIIEVALAENGVLRSARLHPMALDGEGVPHPDPEGAAIGSIQELSDADFPDSKLIIEADGTLRW
ncbi:MAG: poly-gamma-glutamate capsule biosynthesis protein CapA/YwtB (metallophosphatase superfamily) [Myxococcota bacterium]|jgi:poly-gamma-glutamate capsule biosynthesis protein CapA/YwtB (metallophosphatase superfamily)